MMITTSLKFISYYIFALSYKYISRMMFFMKKQGKRNSKDLQLNQKVYELTLKEEKSSTEQSNNEVEINKYINGIVIKLEKELKKKNQQLKQKEHLLLIYFDQIAINEAKIQALRKDLREASSLKAFHQHEKVIQSEQSQMMIKIIKLYEKRTLDQKDLQIKNLLILTENQRSDIDRLLFILAEKEEKYKLRLTELEQEQNLLVKAEVLQSYKAKILNQQNQNERNRSKIRELSINKQIIFQLEDSNKKIKEQLKELHRSHHELHNISQKIIDEKSQEIESLKRQNICRCKQNMDLYEEERIQLKQILIHKERQLLALQKIYNKQANNQKIASALYEYYLDRLSSCPQDEMDKHEYEDVQFILEGLYEKSLKEK